MDVMATAQAIGLVASGSGDVFGTIEEAVVLAALDELATQNATFAGLIAEARARVLTSRSAGIEKVEGDSVFARGGAREVQLRYRSEMGEIFTDLAIDVAMAKAGSASEPRVTAEV